MLVWLDNDHTNNMPYVKQITSSGVQVKLLNTNTELQEWLTSQEHRWPNKATKKTVRILSNQSGDGDGEATGERLCRWLKDPTNPWHVCPFMLFCENPTSIPIEPNSKKGIWISCTWSNILIFATSPAVPKKFLTNSSKNMDFRPKSLLDHL